jgi:alkyl sulfatase BDS1-like metallo-beta-lactamase superfamily hydrolase
MTWNSVCRGTSLIYVLLLTAPLAMAQTPPVPSKPATEATKAANRAVLQSLPFANKQSFDDAQRGLTTA